MKKVKDGERLSTVLDMIGVTVTDFSKNIGYASTKSVYDIINGQTALKSAICYRIAKAYPEVNVNFLLRGDGPVILDRPKAIGQANLVQEQAPSIATVSGRFTSNKKPITRRFR